MPAVDRACQTVRPLRRRHSKIDFLGEGVDGALTAQKIRGGTLDHPSYIPSANSKQPRSVRKDRYTVFCESKGRRAQECRKVTGVNAGRNSDRFTAASFA